MKFLPSLLVAGTLLGQGMPERPKLLGVAHMSLFVSDLAKARIFYEDFLGYAEPFVLNNPDGSVQMAFVKINDQQWIELVASPAKQDGQLNHIGLYTDNVEQMRRYLASRGVKTPGQIVTNRIGNKKINIQDPDDHGVEIVEYQPASMTGRDVGKHLPATRISDHMMHVGILVGKLDSAKQFYHGILGFDEFWRGNSANSTTLSWVNLRLPDSPDYVEFMLYRDLPAQNQRGTQHHICLVVPDMQKAMETLKTRKGYTRDMEIRTGVNRKRQLNLYDPDGTRVELMEADTVDGKPAPPSTLAPPR